MELEVHKLLRWVLARRVPRDHFARIWRELNSDGVGGVAFSEFEAFLEPAFTFELETAAAPHIDLTTASEAPKTPSKKGNSIFGLSFRTLQAASPSPQKGK